MYNFQWCCLPEGKANRLILCQEFLVAAILLVHQAHPSASLIHYMDNVLLVHESSSTLHQVFITVDNALHNTDLVMTLKRYKPWHLFHIWVTLVNKDLSCPQLFRTQVNHLTSLTDFQTLLDNIIGSAQLLTNDS